MHKFTTMITEPGMTVRYKTMWVETQQLNIIKKLLDSLQPVSPLGSSAGGILQNK